MKMNHIGHFEKKPDNEIMILDLER